MKLYMPTLVYYEKGCVKKYKKELAALGKKALLVTGKHSSRKNGSLDDVMTALSEEGREYVIFDDIEENPSVETVMKARDTGLLEQVDFVVGIGGGSPMDAAKAIALMIANPDAKQEALYQKISLPALPVAAVPTTAGTGSEVTPYAILTLHKEKTKKSISHRIFPRLALADASYLKTGTPSGNINTAVDTLAHLVESYLNTNSDSYNRMYSERGLVIWGGMKEALLSGDFSEKVLHTMLESCTLGGMAISHTGTSLPHGLSYMVTYEMGLPHGKAVGIFLAGYLKFCETKDKETAGRVLSLLGFESSDAFGAYLKKLLGTVEMNTDMLSDNAKAIMGNAAKRANCPYPVTEEEILAMKQD